jgi:hypothetical protein
LCVAENFKTSRLVLQAWLQSAPELVVIGLILYRNILPAGPAVVVPAPLLLQVRSCCWQHLVLEGAFWCSQPRYKQLQHATMGCAVWHWQRACPRLLVTTVTLTARSWTTLWCHTAWTNRPTGAALKAAGVTPTQQWWRPQRVGLGFPAEGTEGEGRASTAAQCLPGVC